MIATLKTLIAVLAAGAAFDESVVTELNYAGSLTRQLSGDEPVVKRFSFRCQVDPAHDAERRLSFLLEERGGGGWAWPERFGAIALDRQGRSRGGAGIRLLQEHNSVLNPVALRMPLFPDTGELVEGASWRDDHWRYDVLRRETVAGRDCWCIDAVGGPGQRERLWVESGSPLVVAAEQRVTLGRGDEFQLRYELQAARVLVGNESDRNNRPFTGLMALKESLKREPDATGGALTRAQLSAAAKALPGLEEDAAGTPYERLVAVVARDVEDQTRRSTEVGRLEAKFLGRNPGEWSLKGLNGQPIPAADRAGKIVVLHFWEYRGEPLEEPYGQVGYLDYLNQRRTKLGVQVYGVAVDPRLGLPAEAGAAVRSVRKLAEFMRLGYPVVGDDGTLLAKFGDPRQLGAPLPLWVVLRPDGTVTHYKVGYYDVDPRAGLRELDAVLVELIRDARGAAADGNSP